MALPFPEISPFVFPPVGPFEVAGMSLGPFGIRWYAMGYVVGILLAWRYGTALIRNARLWPHRGPAATSLQIDDLILWATLGIILGGRLGYLLFYSPATFWEAPGQIVQVWNGGMSFHGGALGVVIATLVFARLNKIDILRLGDVVAASAPFGLFLVRVANFINGELWGRPTDVPWAMVFPNAPTAEPRHPSQLYEAGLEGIALFLIMRWATHRAGMLDRRGVVVGLFLAGYGLIRIALEQVREPDLEYMNAFPFGLTMGMMLSAPMVIAGAIFIWRGLKEPVPETVWTPEPETAHDPA